MKGRFAALAAGSALILTSCASIGSGVDTPQPYPHASANAAACAALGDFEENPNYGSFLPVSRAALGADEPILGDAGTLAQAIINHEPESKVRAAAQKLSADCGLTP